jgi:hypothetical protein
VIGRLLRRDSVQAALCFVLAAVAYTWPLAAHPMTRLAAPVGPGDPYLNLWILGWDLRTIGHDPLALLTGRVFDANIFFPAAGTLAYSDHLLLQALAAWPLWVLSGNLTACYNALLVVSMIASALAMYALARSVTGSHPGAVVAGLAWGFLPFRFAHLLHLQLQALYFLPLAFLFLHRLVAGRRRRDAVLLGVAAGLQAISSVYWGVATGLALSVGAVALAIGVGRWRSLPLFRRLVLAAVVGVLVAAPFVWPYWVVQQREGFSRNLYQAARHEAVVGSYLRAAPGNLLYGRTGWLRPPAPAEGTEHEGPEQELFPGFALLALAAYGAGRAWRRDGKPLAAAMAAVGLVGFVVSLGPDGARPLYAFLHRFVFGFQAVRAPARFGVLVGFSLAVMAAVGVRELLASRGRLVPALLVAFFALELVNVPLPTVPAPPASSGAARWLRDAAGPGAVLSLPLDADAGNTPAMLDSLGHGRPIVNGYSGQRPAFFMALVDTLSRTPSAEALWTLRDLGVRFVVSPAPLAAGPLVCRGRFDGTDVYELVWTPEVEAALPRPEAPPPPDPGPVPFARAERAEYRVVWLTTGTLGVAAGRAIVTGEASESGSGTPDGYRVAVEVESADWVKRFFEARDRFETTTDAQLLPLAQEQHLREGRRVVDRSTRFDAGRGTVTIDNGPALPLPPGARDALAAFLYARTLPLAAGYEATFPVVEGGRQLSASLKVTGEEPAVVEGRRVNAWRVEARFDSRTSRRPIQASLAITRDERRVPVEIRVDAGFGSFRVQLVGYSSR